MAKSKQEKLEAQLEKEKIKEEKRQEKNIKKKNKSEEKKTKIKPNNSGGKHFLAVLLWILIIAIFAYGVMSLLTKEDSKSLKRQLTGYYSELSASKTLEMNSNSFAEAFVTDYYTKKGDEQEYLERLSDYLAEGLNLEPPKTSMEVIEAKSTNAEINDKIANITVRAKIKLSIPKNNKEDSFTTKIKTVNVVVPVKCDKEGNYAVVTLPYYKAIANNPNNIKMYSENSNTTDEDETLVKQCESLVGNFFKAYCGTKPSELKYYVTEDYGTVATLKNDIEFKTADTINVIKLGNNKWKIDTLVTLSNSGIEEKQHFVLYVTKGPENRLYVEKMTTT